MRVAMIGSFGLAPKGTIAVRALPLARALARRGHTVTLVDGGNRLGEKLFDEQVNVWSDPWDKDVPVSPWDSGSMLARRYRRL